MTNRTIPGSGASDKPTPRRTIPGAPPPAPSKSAKKGKATTKDTPSTNTPPNAVQVPDATSAALICQAPTAPTQVANALKVTPSDLAEQAETQAAIAAVDAITTPSSNTAPASTPAQKVICDRIAQLSSKSKNATTTVAIDELNSLLSKVQQAESDSVHAKQGAEQKRKLVLLLQFLHLFNLFFPQQGGKGGGGGGGEMVSFAPKAMPPALQMCTGQEVAALGKVFDSLANGPLQGGGGDALEVLDNIEKASDEEVLQGVSFATVREMVLKLTAPPTPARQSERDGLSAPQDAFFKVAGGGNSSSSPGGDAVSFIQESELEPEGGQPESAPPAGTSASKKGEQGGKGVILGDSGKKSDGGAASAVKEPINTTEVKTAAAEPKLNWAAMAEEDDDDLGEAPVFEPISTTPSATETEPATKPAASNAGAEGTLASPKPKKKQAGSGGGKSGGGGKAANRNADGKGAKQVQPAPPTPKAPKVDQDGFILQESKRTKYLQSKQQQQQQQRGGNARARGGAKRGAGGGAGDGASKPNPSAAATQ
ncbi:hypothetical protein NDA10_006854 [Ustilago hordei]|uniref:Uncharacterized protein n=1 Tax=Ustilago hordei TaxID=120017 RepID=I2FVZ1_USTHO|nr:hypothetical protein NDA10_006854 [Ustilago hordei]UTT96499.1 hypothetical protein NDA17_005005 [Ustilago hordei]CCF51084.1 uncharacterized protein UHOR_00937 [Ustilago hordei]